MMLIAIAASKSSGEGELDFNWIPELPFTLTLVDPENMKGERIEVCKPS